MLGPAPLCFGAVSQQRPARTRAGGKINLCFCFPGPIPEAVALEGERGRRALWLGARALLGCATAPAPRRGAGGGCACVGAWFR